VYLRGFLRREAPDFPLYPFTFRLQKPHITKKNAAPFWSGCCRYVM
jgi:hypothetical protein